MDCTVIGDSIIRDLPRPTPTLRRFSVQCVPGARAPTIEYGIRTGRGKPTTKGRQLRVKGYRHIIIHCGTNQLWTADPPSVLAGRLVRDMQDLLRTIRIWNPSAKIAISAVLPRPRDERHSTDRIKEANRALKSFAANNRLLFIRSFRKFMCGQQIRKEFFTDGLHLNHKGKLALMKSFSQHFTNAK